MASLFQSIQGFFNLGVVTGSFNFGDLFSLQFANGAVNAEQVLRRFFFLSELVDADDYATAGFNVHLPFVSGILDLFLDVALGDSFRSATDFINLVDVFPAFFFQFVGQSFYIVGAAQRVNGVSQAGFVSNDLLRAQSDGNGFSRRQSQCFVFGVRVQGLGATHNSGSGLQSNTDDVVVRLLSGQHGTSGLGMEAQHHGFRFLCMEAFLHDFRPYAAGSTELGNFFQYVVVGIPEEGQTASESVDVHAGFQGSFYISDAVGDGEGDFLSSGGACFTDMVAGNGDGVPFRNVLGAIFKDVGDQTHGRFRREDVGAAGSVFLQDIVLNGAAQCFLGNALLLGYGDVHAQQYGSRSIDGHGGGNFVQLDLVEQDFHISQGVNRNAYLANFAFSHRIGGIITDLGRQVECAGQAAATVSQQVTITLVGFFGSGEASVHTHGPETAAIHRGLYATGVRIFAGEAQITFVIEAFQIQRGVQTVGFQVSAFREFGTFSIGFSHVLVKSRFQSFICHSQILLKNIKCFHSMEWTFPRYGESARRGRFMARSGRIMSTKGRSHVPGRAAETAASPVTIVNLFTN